MKLLVNSGVVLGLAAVMTSCLAGGDNPGIEYSPQMYHSVPYEPLSQVTEEDAGMWLTATEDREVGEFYNSNPYNQHNMTMRTPPANTVPRNANGYTPYRLPKDSLTLAAETITSPIEAGNEEALANGKLLYDRFCEHCHGAKGQGDGLVAEKYAGVANLTTPAYTGITRGHIFHVITHGKGLMMPHGSQVNQQERWEIAEYVKKLQGSAN